MTDLFPLKLLRSRTLQWRLAGSRIGGGQPTAGPPQMGRSDGGGHWVADIGELPLNRGPQVKTYRALLLTLDAFAEPMVVPVYDQPNIPRPGEWEAGLPLAPHSDDTPYSDGTYYDGSTTVATVAVDADLRATSMRIQIETEGVVLEGGEYFTPLDEQGYPRLHMIARVEDLGEGLYEVSFMPPLRGALAAGEPIDFDRPRCVMNLVDNAADAWPKLERPYRARPSLSLVEAFFPWS